MDINDDNIDIDQLLKLANSIANDNVKNNIPVQEAQLINNNNQQPRQPPSQQSNKPSQQQSQPRQPPQQQSNKPSQQPSQPRQPSQEVQEVQIEKVVENNINSNQDNNQQLGNNELSNFSDISNLSNLSNDISSEVVIEKICKIPKPTFYFIITSIIIGYLLYTFTSSKVPEKKKK